MPAEVYNANPTVFATSKTSAASRSLWIDDIDAWRDEESDEVEPIDADEIFGAHRSFYLTHQAGYIN